MLKRAMTDTAVNPAYSDQFHLYKTSFEFLFSYCEKVICHDTWLLASP